MNIITAINLKSKIGYPEGDSKLNLLKTGVYQSLFKSLYPNFV